MSVPGFSQTDHLLQLHPHRDLMECVSHPFKEENSGLNGLSQKQQVNV